MNSFAAFTVSIIFFYLIGFVKRPEKFQWMDKNYTTAIKGFSILTVVWAHTGSKFGVGGIQFIAGIGVSLFLICSGYGLEISYQKNGLQGFWKKRVLGVCIPFWGVELVGLLFTGDFSIKKYFLDFAFIQPATSYGWFMGYIVICYLIFYGVKVLVRHEKSLMILLGVFAIWFILDSVFLAKTNMPALRARQMLSFPAGILLAMKKEEIERHLTQTKSMQILMGGGTACLLFMAITQLHIVKELPYLASNVLSLPTCLPMAIGIVAFGKNFNRIFENKALHIIGLMSYEVYLVHAFTLHIINGAGLNVIEFIILTGLCAFVLYIGTNKLRQCIK